MSHRQRQARRSRARGTGPRKGLVILCALVAALGITAGLSAVGYVVATAASAPELDELNKQDKGTSSVIFAADGSRLGYVQSDEIRTPIPSRKMPRRLREATVAIEDERFFRHKGVDYEAIVRAGVKNLRSRKTLQGGSTITQQLVRSIYIEDPGRTYERKIREAKLASELEEKRSKKWILKEYLNSVPYGTVNGRTAIGVEAAASIFFAKHAEDLTLGEAALLAGLPQAPSQYNPRRNLETALARRDDVLRAMVNNGYISERQARRAMRRAPKIRKGSRYIKRREPYFFDFVEEQLIEEYGAGVYRRGGLEVHTTVVPEFQEAGRKAIDASLGQPGDPSSAVVSIDPKTGYIRAMASSGTYNDRTFNLAAQGHRQPGSAFKTMVLTTALRQGVNPRSTYYDSKPLRLQVPGFGEYKVKTYDNTYGGRMDLVRATLRSDNAVYAQLDADVGPDKVAETARLMGIRSKLNGYIAEGLGGLESGVSPLEMANAYATLAAGGVRSRPKAIRKFVFPDGKSEQLGRPARKRVFSDGVASEVTRILEQNVQAGTGTKASFGCPTAGKTGTTDNFNDAWFVGYTPDLATSVWVGYPNALKEMKGVHGINVAGGTFPAQIFHDFMTVARRDDCRAFAPPTEPVLFKPFSGRYASKGLDPSEVGQGGTFPNGDGTTTTTEPDAQEAPTPAEGEGEEDGGGEGDQNGGDEGGGETEPFDPREYDAEPAVPPADAGGGTGAPGA